MSNPTDAEQLLESLDADPLESDLLEALLDELRSLRAENDRLADRIAELEDSVETLESHTKTLESRTETVERSVDDRETNDRRLERVEALAEATRNRTGANKARLEELQARELEKGAHLREANVDVHEIDVADDALERVTKTDGERYYRLPDHDDPLDRSGTTALAHGDLLPIQQLARMDEDMRRSTTNALPTRLAAKLWRARTDPTVGDDPWTRGCKGVDEYVAASELKHWIRRQEQGISETYAKKLVSRTIDAILDLSKHRLAVRKRTQRKNGLEYTERRLVLPSDAEIPGETTTPSDADRQLPETADVHG
ncbi:hypothetical protein [Natrinema salaciae]|uniref:Uncharacterized protein n=1 Tax=Natrinema salaciae TaxID=1186196 RepID=A0A1H8ZWA6_9EURY|nr:hypothetical protein [Natrinema salaciae]SEP68561.1 hypothetical protein SAMN04489841_0278 [Natrinema salaciae]